MLATMTWQQLLGWYQFYQTDPFGEERADLRNGILCSLYANAHRGKGKKEYTPTDFMPFTKKEEQKPMDKTRWEQFKQRAKAYASIGDRKSRDRDPNRER